MPDAYSGNIENKMADDSAWPRTKQEECDFCGQEYLDSAFPGCCLMCYSQAKTALDGYLAKQTPMSKHDREIMEAYYETI